MLKWPKQLKYICNYKLRCQNHFLQNVNNEEDRKTYKCELFCVKITEEIIKNKRKKKNKY